jgi:hypothetical protein
MGGTDSSAVDYPLESFRQIQNTSISISISIPSQLKSQVETGYSNSSLHCQSMQDWFEKPHWRNLDLDQAYVDVLIGSNPLSTIDEVLRQTICHEEGKFRQTVVGHWNASNSVLLSEWEFKLIYLAIHDFHHRPAREEHKVRSRCSNKIQLPSYDYQCKDAKFLVTSLPGIGMGASVRLSATTDVTAAIANDRIPLFLDNAASGPAFLKTPAQLFSCNRRDPQCIFLPTSPCTLLLSDLDESVLLTEPEGRRVRRSGSFPDHLAHHRILIMTPKVLAGPFESNARFMNSFREKVQARALGLIDEWYASLGGIQEPETTAKLLFLKSAALRITQQEARVSKEGVYQYLRQDNRIAHAIGLYLLRPNPTTTATLHEELHGILPASMNPETTVGLPIRGSDKCRAESTCLPFDRYMQLARETWEEKISRNNNQGKRGSLIMTTEDKILFEKRLLYTKESGFPLDFVVNDKDPLQGSGLAKVYGESADRIMISSLLAIQMQLRAGSIYGNCCSNFHLMLFDFAKEGCGLTEKATCLQETKNYKVCCGWRNDEGCDAIRKEHHEEISRTAAEKAALLTSSVAISNLASEGF